MDNDSDEFLQRETVIGQKLAPYNPTNYEAIEIALSMQEIVEGDVVYDLGCGDARYLVMVRFLFLRIDYVGCI
jgi:hypothetical protein